MQPENKHLIKRYFTFSKNERSAIFLLIALAVIFFLLPHLYPALMHTKQQIIANDSTQKNDFPVASHTDSIFENDAHKPFYKNKSTAYVPTLFYFDPNTATQDEWLRLGVREKTAATIIRYRMKGGKFKDPQDIRKIWGLSAEVANRLIPYVRIQAADLHNENVKRQNDVSLHKKNNVIQLDINKADQEKWESLKGIGPALAARIVTFRDKLGGFVSVYQVGETYGLPDSTFQQLLPFLVYNGHPVNKLNINMHTADQLAKHPYINYKTAKAIVMYREQNGSYKAVEAVKRIESISPETYNKIEKYISVE